MSQSRWKVSVTTPIDGVFVFNSARKTFTTNIANTLQKITHPHILADINRAVGAAPLPESIQQNEREPIKLHGYTIQIEYLGRRDEMAEAAEQARIAAKVVPSPEQQKVADKLDAILKPFGFDVPYDFKKKASVFAYLDKASISVSLISGKPTVTYYAYSFSSKEAHHEHLARIEKVHPALQEVLEEYNHNA